MKRFYGFLPVLLAVILLGSCASLFQTPKDPWVGVSKDELVKQSGDKSWDDSVLQALAETKSVNRKPPPGFPPKFLVRFDAIPAPEPLLQ